MAQHVSAVLGARTLQSSATDRHTAATQYDRLSENYEWPTPTAAGLPEAAAAAPAAPILLDRAIHSEAAAEPNFGGTKPKLTTEFSELEEDTAAWGSRDMQFGAGKNLTDQPYTWLARHSVQLPLPMTATPIQDRYDDL